MAGKKRYRVLCADLDWPARADIVKRAAAGEFIPLDAQGPRTVALRGEVRDDIPAYAITMLVEQGAIEPVSDGEEV